MKVLEGGYLAHVYAGRALPDNDLSHLLMLDELPQWGEGARDQLKWIDSIPLEYPASGIGDFREPCLQVLDAAGQSACDIRYKSHVIKKGKPSLPGLPATFALDDEAQTLEILCEDAHLGLEIVLRFTAFEELSVIAKSVDVKSMKAPVTLWRILSSCLDLDNSDYDLITLTGAWGRERRPNRHALHAGKQSVDSIRGESSHQCNPFIALAEHAATEDFGEAFGFSFVYSGNFIATAEVAPTGGTRILMGINPYDFSRLLEPGESFAAPEVLIGFSSEGLGGLSRTYHDLMRKHLLRGRYKDKRRPVLINNWEGTYFDFDEEKLLAIARESSKLGIEMLVMDDGWFGKRNDDNTSLGDWHVNEGKLKGGLKHLVDEVNNLGMKFGIWFEPEMVSPNSELYKAHPDWCLHAKGRGCSRSRNQLVLDFSRDDVRNHIYAMMKDVLSSANIGYTAFHQMFLFWSLIIHRSLYNQAPKKVI
ncbi:MAG: alpha-galactosidase [Clostridiales bacterium]|nr:alpha-galactosidase [Clostridiales bacterium]